MSMFHELMMRKKEQIMYATIKGTLTENDGVFSGFSDSNYLQINNGISVGQNFEIYTKFTTGASLSSNQELIAGKISSDLYLRIFIQNGATLFTSARVVGASSISHNQTSYSFQTNTTYSVKVKYDGANKLDVFIYDNTGQQVKTNSFTLSNQINTFNSLLIGTVGTTTSIWGGSIDLNRSYIKLGSTKYNLQAVVGYTIVGSPTIVDGVVSGFSSANYLRLPQISAGTVKSFEISTKFTTGAILTDSTIIGIMLAYNYGVNIYAGSRYFLGRVRIGANYYEIISAINTVAENTTYFVKFIVDTEIGKEYLKISTDNSNWQIYERDISTSVINNSIQWQIGNGSVGVFGGSIDLNNTNIKVNNKLYFNGQQA